MANIKKLEMADAVSVNPHVSILKSFLGLQTKVVYEPSKSLIDVFTYDYTAEMGDRMEKLLTCSPESLEKEINKCGIIEKTPIGNIRLEACVSREHLFAAMQLFHFVDFQYEPMTDVKFYEGKEAELIATIL